MKFKSTVIAASVLAGIMSLSAGAYAMGGASGAHVNYPTTGKIGAVMMNPYGIAPLTAVIRNGGYSLSDISVRIVPKDGGQEITYTVSDAKARTHGGIPIFGLYAGYRNTVEVSYTKTTEGKSERVEKEVYRIYAGPANIATAGYAGVTSVFPVAEVKKVDPAFSDRLYLINNMIAATPNTTARSGTTRWAAHSNGTVIRRTPSTTRRVRSAGTWNPRRSTIRTISIWPAS